MGNKRNMTSTDFSILLVKTIMRINMFSSAEMALPENTQWAKHRIEKLERHFKDLNINRQLYNEAEAESIERKIEEIKSNINTFPREFIS